jgi:hypothetical protein
MQDNEAQMSDIDQPLGRSSADQIRDCRVGPLPLGDAASVLASHLLTPAMFEIKTGAS